MRELAELLEMATSAKGPSAEFDLALHKRFPPPWLPKRGRNRRENIPQYTASVDAALSMVSAVLPGWTWRLASCSVSDDAWVCPDFNDPKHGPRFQATFNDAYDGRDPAEVIMEATDVARHPPGQPALTLIEAMLRGRIFVAPMSATSSE